MEPASPQPFGGPMRCMEIRGGSRAVEETFNTPGLSAWLYSSPFEGAERGGDVHYVSLCGGGLITRVVIADVSGHGARVSEFSDALRTLMRKNINTKSQSRLVQALNRQFGETAQSLRFATAVVATYLATDRSLTISNVGHPHPLWYRAETKEWLSLEATRLEQGNLPLGIDDDSTYHQFTVKLGPGDILCFYTDALSEAADSSGRLLGEDGLVRLARGLDPTEPQRLHSTLLAGVNVYRGGRPSDDDVTLLVLHHNGGGPRPPSLMEKFDVYSKVFGLRSY
jgi:sigma-B regulation protein RsbU (phosphoserine phosphatase)